MDHELKPPYLPPKDRVISDNEIEKQANLKIPVIDQIKVFLFIVILHFHIMHL